MSRYIIQQTLVENEIDIVDAWNGCEPVATVIRLEPANRFRWRLRHPEKYRKGHPTEGRADTLDLAIQQAHEAL